MHRFCAYRVARQWSGFGIWFWCASKHGIATANDGLLVDYFLQNGIEKRSTHCHQTRFIQSKYEQ